MDIAQLLDIFLHLDKHLATLVQAYGPWVYGLLFLIVFVETGVVVMPFLPGDSLMFIVGALCGAGLMSYGLAVPILLAATRVQSRKPGPASDKKSCPCFCPDMAFIRAKEIRWGK